MAVKRWEFDPCRFREDKEHGRFRVRWSIGRDMEWLDRYLKVIDDDYNSPWGPSLDWVTDGTATVFSNRNDAQEWADRFNSYRKKKPSESFDVVEL